MLKVGTVLYAAAFLAAYVIPTAVGANVDRLGALVAGPLAACVLADRSALRRGVLIVLAPFLLYWQVNAPLSDFASTLSNPSVEASYYAPLLDELRALGVGYAARPARIEVVPTARPLGGGVGGGTRRDGPRLGAPAGPLPQRALLRRIDPADPGALPRMALAAGDLLRRPARRAAGLLRDRRGAAAGERLPGRRRRRGAGALQAHAFLREVWHSAHWRLFAVLGAPPLAQPPAALTQMQGDSFTLAAPGRGRYLVRVRFSNYWAISARARLRERSARRVDVPQHRPRRQPRRRDRFLADADLRPRSALPLSIARRC